MFNEEIKNLQKEDLGKTFSNLGFYFVKAIKEEF